MSSGVLVFRSTGVNKQKVHIGTDYIEFGLNEERITLTVSRSGIVTEMSLSPDSNILMSWGKIAVFVERSKNQVLLNIKADKDILIVREGSNFQKGIDKPKAV